MKATPLVLMTLLATISLTILVLNVLQTPRTITCPEGTRMCADGTELTRDPLTCRFPKCPVQTEHRFYISRNPEHCALALFACENGLHFYDETGCGCTTEPIECSDDTRTCPDGTSVSRVSPSCAFAACP